MGTNLMSLARSGDKFLKLYGDRKMVRTLPYLRRVAYLDSTGVQYIDTGYRACQNSFFEFDFDIKSSVWTQIAFGATTANGTAGIGETISLNGGRSSNGALQFINTYGGTNIDNLNGKRCVGSYDVATGDFSINDESVVSIGAPLSKRATHTIYLCAQNLNGSMYAGLPCKFRSWAVKESGSLVMSLIPVLDLSGRPAMYDEVSGQFFYNQGTGEFTWGELDAQTL